MGKNVLIIGASGDIGIAIAKRLAADGYQLLLHYNKNRGKIHELRDVVPSESILAEIQADLSNRVEINELLKKLVFPVDCLVFAAGTVNFGLFHEASEAVMDEMLLLHVKAPWMITKHILPSMISRKSGKIVLISSIWGTVGASFEVIYSTVKGAQNSFVRSLAKEVAQSGISVNGVSPGFIDTKMNEHLTVIEKEAICAEIAESRAGTPGEVAHTVQFLLDEQTKYIQGEIIRVDGGWN